MRQEDQAEALFLIDKAASAIQASYHPGRPMFSVMNRLRDEIDRAREEVGRTVPRTGTPHRA